MYEILSKVNYKKLFEKIENMKKQNMKYNYTKFNEIFCENMIFFKLYF